MSSRSGSPEPATSFRLQELAAELVARVCLFVALQRYDYAESRRPLPSPLATLASSNRLLHAIAAPLLHRRATGDIHKEHCTQGECCRYLKRLSFTLYLKDVVQSPHYPPQPPWELHNLETLELRGSLSPSTLESPTITTLLLRRLYADAPEPNQVYLPALRTVSASQVHQSWLEILARTPTVTSFTMAIAQSAMVFQDLPLISWCGDMFDRLESFTLEVPPARQLEKSLTPLEIVVGGLKVSPSAPLRSLTLNVRLQLHQAPSRLSFARYLNALRAFAGVSLTSLALDDYVLVYAADLEALAEAFPTLTKLAFGDRTVWSGSREDHLVALSRFPSLTSLDCPRWPDVDGDYIEPEELVRLVGRALPHLQLLGLSGQQSDGQWWRLGKGRDAMGWPSRVDMVSFYSMDLER